MKATKAIWNHFSEVKKYPALKNDITTDIAIIGGGITGISAAKLLSQKGREVTVLESRKVGGGTSSHSTGNLYYTIDHILSSLQSKYDTDVIQNVAESRAQALEQIKAWNRQYDLDCDYKEVPWYLYTDDQQSLDKINKELNLGKEAGLSIMKADEDEIFYPSKKAIKIPRQNQINPMQYVQGLAKTVNDDQCQIYEQTTVQSVEKENDDYILQTPTAEIRASYVVHATHTPKGIMMVQSLLGPYREYGIACRVNDQELPDGIFWGYHDGKKVSTRNYSRNGKNYVIVVGEAHKVGHGESNVDHVEKLKDFARKYFSVEDTEFIWGGQHYRPADLLPYIGFRNQNSREMIATGYSTDGLVYGTLAAMILSDLISGTENQWSDLYNSLRKQPFKSAEKFMEENLDVAKEFVQSDAEKDIELEDLSKGEGRVIEKDGDELAAYRQDDGTLKVVSAICTHMRCTVHWNNAEQTWDCPCHGSRFQTDGSVIEGPAYEPLKEIQT